MNLSTDYLGLPLANPFVAGASPLVDRLDLVRRLEDAGVGAIVLHSLFEEQIAHHQWGVSQFVEAHEESFAEAGSFFPPKVHFAVGPDEYLDLVWRVKEAVSVPVIASLNGVHEGTWADYARLIEEAGADALELNLYAAPRFSEEDSRKVEEGYLRIVRRVRAAIQLPLAVKLSPFFTALGPFCVHLAEAGADAVVLFNRFYQPDFDLDDLSIVPRLRLSDPSELLLRLRWTALLYGRTKLKISVSGGVHERDDALKALAAGASTVQMVSALLKDGPEHLAAVKAGVAAWLEEREYNALDDLRGSLSALRAPDPEALERANYLKILQSWRG